MQEHNSGVNAVAVMPDGKRFLSGSISDVAVWLLRPPPGTPADGYGESNGYSAQDIRTFQSADWDSLSMDQQLACYSEVGRRLQDEEVAHAAGMCLAHCNRTHVNTFRLHDRAFINALIALPDNEHALSGSGDSTVKLFNVNDGTVLRTFTHPTGHGDRVSCLALLPDGLRFVYGSVDRTARVVEHGLAPHPQ